jgi:K+-sensing histidine kinase KdpD
VELSGDTDAVTIQVTNYGRTIAADALRALFEPLRAAAGTESSAKRGPGLGLYIVDPIVAAHGRDRGGHVRRRRGDPFYRKAAPYGVAPACVLACRVNAPSSTLW